MIYEPPNIATNGKKIVGLSLEPHHIAMWLAVIHVEPANPARPRAAGGAMGLRKIWTLGAFSRTSFRLYSWPAWLSTDMVGLFYEDLVARCLYPVFVSCLAIVLTKECI